MAGYVREYTGWREFAAQPLIRRELPTDVVPVMFSFGAPIAIANGHAPDRWETHGSFTTGAYDTYVLTRCVGPSYGLQVNFTILGARLLFGVPLRELTNRVVALDEVFGRESGLLVEQLEEAPSWDARFDLIDRTLHQRLTRVMSPPAGVLCAWHRLADTRGRTSVRAIVDEVGWSQKHLVAQCHEHLGLAPKTLGRVLRFGVAVEHIKSCGPAGHTTLTDIALAAGYYDHAHFVRDCREFAGISPGGLASELLPDRGGFLVDR